MLYKILGFLGIRINILLIGRNNVICGKKFQISGPTKFKTYDNGVIRIGNDCVLMSAEMFNPIGRNLRSYIRAEKNSEIIIGNNVGMSCVTIWAKKKIRIGNNVKIGADTVILDSDIHSLDYMDRRTPMYDVTNCFKKEIFIGDDVFIGARTIITKGVSIGDRSIIAAGSVVCRDIPSDEVWGGNPAKFLRSIVNERP